MSATIEKEERLKETFKVSDLIEYMREQGLVIVPRQEAMQDKLKDQMMRKKFLTYKQIADAQLWGEIGKGAVKAIARKQVLDHEIDKTGNAFRISRHAVERIGKNRGTL